MKEYTTKVAVLNELDGRAFSARFETRENADRWIRSNSTKRSHPWGFPEREINEKELTDELKDRVISRRRDDEDGIVYYKIKADFVIKITDLSKDIKYLIKLCREKRRGAYPTVLEIIEAVMENIEGRPEKLNEALEKRERVRNAYPMPQ